VVFASLRQYAPHRHPHHAGSVPVMSHFKYIDRGHVRASIVSHLGLLKNQILSVARFKKVKKRHHTQLHGDPSNHCCRSYSDLMVFSKWRREVK